MAVWQYFGLKGNPYFKEAISLENVRLFRGSSRVELAEQLLLHIDTGEAPMILLESAPGIGKTSLVNFAKAKLEEGREYYIYPRRIEISEHSTRETLAAEYLSALIGAAFAGEPDRPWLKDPAFSKAMEMITDSLKKGGWSGSLTIAGFGGGLDARGIHQAARHLPWDTWLALVENVLGVLKQRRKGVVIHLNNIDAVCDSHPVEVVQLFDEARELLTLPHLHTIMCATTDFRDALIEADRRRILDNITLLVDIGTLSGGEFLEAVHARYEDFKISDTFTPPLADAALKHVYDVFDGDLRNTFLMATAAIVEAARDPVWKKGTQIQDDYLMRMFAPLLGKLFSSLPVSEKQVLVHLMNKGPATSQKEIIAALGGSQPTINQAIHRLENRRWVATAVSGKKVSCRLTGFGKMLQQAVKDGLLPSPSA